MNAARLPRLILPLIQRRSFQDFSTPTWSVRTLLPSSPASTSEQTPTISASTISHLLRLSALPPPADPASLHDHLHFVRSLQSVPTEGVIPLAAIRDEIDTSQNEYSYKDVLEAEKKLDEEGVGDAGRIEWDPMVLAKRKEGRMFVVDEAATEELVKPELEDKE